MPLNYDLDNSTAIESLEEGLGKDSSTETLHRKKDKKIKNKFFQSALFSAFSGTAKAYYCKDFDSFIEDRHSWATSTNSRAETQLKSLYKTLTAINSELLEHGSRLEIMRQLLPNIISESPDYFCDSFERVLGTSNKKIEPEVKAAAIRYLGIYDSTLKNSGLTRALLSTLRNGDDLEAVAAARSLAEVGDEGTLPALEAAMRRTKSAAARVAMEKTIKELRGD
ncbi:HEAT repeat domain-containing protein [Xanthomonas campestris]|uniref:HEAT repeat domain-containing protein n=1 Tax=Xanthomonas campestris TaxID=339 RepID=UPI002B230D6A|nr:HEAT repeat domain-containing protein [Xanthomonas campestris]MEA9708546.1 HEAT repeat domain-containing protein [Xanthomonas campestris pv. raphani]